MTGRPLGDANDGSRVGVTPEVLPIRGKPYRLLLSGVCRAIWGSWPRRGNVGQAGLHRLFAREYLDGIAGGHGRCAAHVRAATQAGGLTVGTPVGSMAKDYGPCVEKAGFKKISGSPSPTHESGDVAVIQPIRKADAGHMCMDDGTQWVSDIKRPL